MLKRLLLAYVLLFSYAGAILHSVVPHHHHHSEQEAKDHHHDHHAHHSHDDSSEKHDHHHKGATYLLAHSSNADVLVNHSTIDGAVKGKKTEIQAVFIELPVPDQTDAETVFHSPPNNRLTTSTASPFPALRAPPITFC